ncbi:guanylate kinase [Corynascus similis CBS 632.67]
MERRPIVISGPSGVGKGTLCQRLLNAYPGTFTTTVSHTTRNPSPARSLVAQGAFIEFAEFNGNLYGTSKQTVIDQTARGLVADSQMNPRFVFVKPPSFEALDARLRGRGTEVEGSIQRRLAQAKTELAYAETGVHDIIIINDDLDKAFQDLVDFVFKQS